MNCNIDCGNQKIKATDFRLVAHHLTLVFEAQGVTLYPNAQGWVARTHGTPSMAVREYTMSIADMNAVFHHVLGFASGHLCG